MELQESWDGSVVVLPGSDIAWDSHSPSAFVLLQIMNIFFSDFFFPQTEWEWPRGRTGGCCMPWPGAGGRTGDNERLSGCRAGAGAGRASSQSDGYGDGRPSCLPILYNWTNHRQCFIPVGTAGPRIRPGPRAQPLTQISPLGSPSPRG